MESDGTNEGAATPERPVLEGGAYEIIRKRLLDHGQSLRGRLDQLNASRQEVFGAIEPTLIATDRITTNQNAIPRGLFPIGEQQFVDTV